MAGLPNLNTPLMNPGMFKHTTQVKLSSTVVGVLIHFDTSMGYVESGLLETNYLQIVKGL